MIEIDVERNMNDPDEPSLPAAGRVQSVDEYLEVLDEFMPLIQKQLLIRARARADSERQKRGEIDSDSQESTRWIARQLVPSSTYGGAVLAACSALETSMAHVLRYLARKDSGFHEQKRPPRVRLFEHQRAEFQRASGSVPPVAIATSSALDDLLLVRNVVAHSGTSIRDIKDSHLRKLQRVVGAGVGLSFVKDSLVINSNFARRGLNAVQMYLGAALTALFRRYPHERAS